MDFPVNQNQLFRSATLTNLFSDLDDQVCMLEDGLRFWRKEAERLQRELSLKQHEELQAGQRMIGNTLLAMFSAPTAESLTPAAAIAFRKLRDMQTLEEVHAYIDEMGRGIVEELG